MRYEEPSSMVRWDSPLFTVPWSDEDVPGEQIWVATTEGLVKPPKAGTTAVSIYFLTELFKISDGGIGRYRTF